MLFQQVTQGSGGSAAVAKQVSNLLVQEPLSLTTLVINLAIGAVMALGLRWHFKRYGSTLANRDDLGNVFPFVLLTTLLIITVVKSSLALSLGLVGALSIVRFRTPIKEPEELAYLFLSIGLGLGLGANQRLVTVLVFTVILGYMALVSLGRSGALPPRLLVHLSGSHPANGDAAGTQDVLREILRSAEESSTRVDLRRIDRQGPSFHATRYGDRPAEHAKQ